MGFGLGIEEVDCLFESRSSTGGGVFWGPPSPFPPSAQGFGFPPGVHASPRGRGPPCVRTSSPAARLLPSFHPCFPRTGGPGFTLYFPEVRARLSGFHASKCQGLVSGLPLYFPHCFQGTGGQGQAFMLSGARASALLSCFQEARGKASYMLSGGKAFRLSGDHAARLSGFFLTSRPAFRLSGGPAFRRFSGGPASRLSVFRRQGPDFPQASSMLSGDRGPGPGALTSHT